MSDNTARELESETKKWLEKLKKMEPELAELLKYAKEKTVRAALQNMQAYIDDCQHFLDKKDFIRAFEAVIYAWGIWDTLRKCNLVGIHGDKP